MNIIEHLVNVALLGATWVLYLLFALSIAAFAGMFERWVFHRRNIRRVSPLRAQLDTAIALDDEQEILRVLSINYAVESKVLLEGFSFRHGGPDAFADAIESAKSRARQDLDRNTTLLGTIGNNAPFVGLFGTVIGVIQAFSFLGSGDQAAMGNVMAGIAEALVATAVGIFVAIPSVVGYNIAQKKSADIEDRIQTLAKLLSAWMRVREREERWFESRFTDEAGGGEPTHNGAKRAVTSAVTGDN